MESYVNKEVFEERKRQTDKDIESLNQRVKSLEEENKDQQESIRANRESTRSAHKRIDGLEALTKSVNEIATSTALMAQRQDNMCKKVDVIDTKLSAIEGKDGKKWDNMKNTVFNLLVTGILGAIIGAILALVIKK